TEIAPDASSLTPLMAIASPVLVAEGPGGPPHTYVVCAGFTSEGSRRPLPWASTPISILTPPDGQFGPGGWGLVFTSVGRPLEPLQMYVVSDALTSPGSRTPFMFASTPVSSLVPPLAQCAPGGSGVVATSAVP